MPALIMHTKKKLGEFQHVMDFETDSRRIGILGASGSGKSMALKLLAGIQDPDQGRIYLNGGILFDEKLSINQKPQKRRIGYLFQNYALFPNMTVRQNIEMGIRGKVKEKQRELSDILFRFDLEKLQSRYPNQLSGGQQQRVALARILIGHPDMILLDEPFSSQDEYLREQLQKELEKFLADYPGIVILVSHNREEIYRFTEELFILENGSMVQKGSTKNVFLAPDVVAAARLIGCKNIVPYIKKQVGIVELPEWGVTLEIGKKEIPEKGFLGYHGVDFIPVWGEKKENCVPVKRKNLVKLPYEWKFEWLPVNGSGEIQWNVVETKIFSKLNGLGDPDWLQIQKEKLLFLKK